MSRLVHFVILAFAALPALAQDYAREKRVIGALRMRLFVLHS